jgi:hypothetical protein
MSADSGATPPDTKRCAHCGAANAVTAEWCSLCLTRFDVADGPGRQHPEGPAPKRVWTRPRQISPSVRTAGKAIGAVVGIVVALAGLFVVGVFILAASTGNFFGNGK